MASKVKKIAVVASGWHFPAHFYESMMRQKAVEGWEYHFFCVSHRDPSFAIAEKKDHKFKRTLRGKLDKILYKAMATKDYIETLGWYYKEYPNTIGDWGNSNQWLEENDYKEYDLLLFTHDDNLIIHDRLFADTIEDENFDKWDILTNSPGVPEGHIRGSFEFFKPHVITAFGGKFDLSEVTLTREGITTASQSLVELYDWNATVYPTNRLINELGLRLAILSPCYRFSAYVLEGERGYISNTHGMQTEQENMGLKFLHNNGII